MAIFSFLKNHKKPKELNLHEVLDSLPEAIVGIDLSGRVTIWNSFASKLFGWTEKEAVGTLLHDLIIPQNFKDLHQKGMKRYNETQKSRIINKPMELTAINKVGRVFSIELIVSRASKDAKKTGFIGIIRENSKQVQIQKQLKNSHLQSEILSKLIHGFTSSKNTNEILICSMNAVGEGLKWPIGHVFDATNSPILETTGLWRNETGCPLDLFEEQSQQINAAQSPFFQKRAVSNNDIIWIKDTGSEPTFIRHQVCRDFGLKGGISLPITVGSKLIYLLEFFSLNEIDLNPDELIFFTNICSVIGKAIESVESGT